MSIQKNLVDPNNLPEPLIITHPKFNNVANTYINNILFLYPCERRNKRLLWLCQCYCGNYFKAEPKTIRNGNTKSCGCRFLQRMREYNTQYSCNLEGMCFGKLLVLQKDIIKNHRQYWLCQCDCGTKCTLSADTLIQNKVHSCGCLKSYAEYSLKCLFDNYNIHYQTEYVFNDCRSTSGYPLRFDFAIFKDNTLIGLIEYQGDQHSNPNNPWYNNTLVQHDQQKIDYCANHKLPLLHLSKGYDTQQLLETIRGWYPMSVGI